MAKKNTLLWGIGTSAAVALGTVAAVSLRDSENTACESDKGTHSLLRRMSTRLLTEHYTGFVFPSFLRRNSSGNWQKLLGTDCRFKWGLVKVYAVGIYADSAFVRSAQNIRMKNAADLEPMPTSILRSDVNATVVLKFCRHVDSATMSRAIADSLRPRLEANTTGEHSIAVDRLCALLETIEINEHSELAFYIEAKRNDMHIVFKADSGAEAVWLGVVEGSGLSNALLDVYIGKSAIVGGIRNALG